MKTHQLFEAVRQRRLKQIRGGVTAEALAKASENSGWTGLHEAARCICLDQIQGGVNAYSLSLAQENLDGWTALHEAAKQGALRQIRGGATVDALAAAKDFEGRTALHSAVYNKHLDQVVGKITAEQLFAVLDGEGYSALSEIDSQISLLDGGVTYEQMAVAKGKYGYTPVDNLSEFGQLNLIRGGVTALQLRALKPDGRRDALQTALWSCPLDQIQGGIPRGLLSVPELNDVLADSLKFEGFNAREIILMGADASLVLEAIADANHKILTGQEWHLTNQYTRLRALLQLSSELDLSIEGIVDPSVTERLL